MTNSCPFCTLSPDDIIAKCGGFFAKRDGYPISPGHTLLIPMRHVASFFDLTPGEQEDLLKLLDQIKTQLDDEFAPAGYNIGINDGEAAGQTVMHLHVHLVPRFEGDTDDPRGGVRWIFPKKAIYWKDT